MSSPTTTGGGPLTTIFTPPPGCFEYALTQTWSTCTKDWSNSGPVSCFWSEQLPCFASSASTEIVYLAAETGTYASVQRLHYSPGVLPAGYSVVQTSVYAGTTTATGCLSGWDGLDGPWCTKFISGYQNVGYNEINTFPVILPQILVTWASSNLATFTPAAAPVAMLTQAGLVTETRTSQSTALPDETNRPIAHGSNQHSGLTTGAKAGIAVGVVVSVMLLLAIGFLILRRRRRANRQQTTASRASSPHSIESRRPYVDTKAELTGVHVVELPDRERQELESSSEIKEIDAGWTPRELAESQMSHELSSDEPLSPPLSPVSPIGTLSPFGTMSSTAPFSPIEPPQELEASRSTPRR